MTEDYLHNLTKELTKLSIEEKNNLLEKLRIDVDKIDTELSAILVKRINLVIEIGTIKKSLKLSTYDAGREKEIEKNIFYSEDSGINKALRNIYDRIIDESRTIQREREK